VAPQRNRNITFPEVSDLCVSLSQDCPQISCELKQGSFATVLFSSSAIARELVESRWVTIAGRSVEMKPYTLAGANPHYAQNKLFEDKVKHTRALQSRRQSS
jgi:hypothetical protein